ncbi:type IV secretory system conjugative DNA transfer family protein [Photobacterium leiognathi]|uniref:type IV secretory system conjugative DNA transfer family protein n=1 Tax=Photobacterium leiognathi TaxID=553611 RepID=UPI002981C185|nr:type IV secretory system conjugative DNA transfer family protein [Photobacterium leiognathi]
MAITNIEVDKEDSVLEDVRAFDGVRKWKINDKKVEDHGLISLKDLMFLGDSDLRALRDKAIRDPSLINELKDRDLISVREAMVYNTALELSSQMSLSYTLKYGQDIINSIKDQLNLSYPFEQLLIDEKILPPVVSKSSDISSAPSENGFRHVKNSYKIITKPLFVRDAPTAHSYLLSNTLIKPPALPDYDSLPLTSRELQLWANAVFEGWKLGESQATRTLLSSLKILDRDFLGMIIYDELNRVGVISTPIYSVEKIDASASEDEINIGEVRWSLDVGPQFDVDIHSWSVLPKLENLLGDD